LFAELVQLREVLFDSLHEPQGNSRDRFFLAGVASLLLAYPLMDFGEDYWAMAELRTAGLCADQAGHPGLMTWSLIDSMLPTIDQAAPSQAELEVALRFAQQADAVAPPGNYRIRIAILEAKAAALAGDPAAARSALARLAEARDQTPVHDDLLQLGGRMVMPTAKQDLNLGGIYTLLQNYEAAHVHSSAAITAYQNGPAKQRSYIHEAMAHINRMIAGILEGAFDDNVDKAFQHLVDLPEDMRAASLHNAMDRAAALASSAEHKDDRAVKQLKDLVRDYQAVPLTTPPTM
jgi:hypothetical protein